MESRSFIRFGILTVSDRCWKKESVDKSGPALIKLVENDGVGLVTEKQCVPDEVDYIKNVLVDWSDKGKCDVVLTTGGTGFAPRDVTPEATECVIEKKCHGLATSMGVRSASPYAVLSRAVAGIRRSTLVVNLPGSEKGVTECFSFLVPLIPHAVALIKNDTKNVAFHHHNLLSPQISQVEELKVSDRARTSPWPMISVSEAQSIILDNCPSPLIEYIDLMGCAGRVLSKRLTAEHPQPSFRASVKDGYAVVSSDTTPSKKVVGTSTAGIQAWEVELKEGECVRINTGGPVPASADAVIQVEDTTVASADPATGEELIVAFKTLPQPGQDIRAIGSDVSVGDILLEKSTILDCCDIGLLASAGYTSVPTYRLPRVAVVSTGDELVEVGQPKSGAQIWDSNRPTLLTLLKQNGFNPTDGGIVKDQPSLLLWRLTSLAKDHNIIVTTGSVSMGERDYLKLVLQKDLNAQILFGRVNLKPGKPTTFAKCVSEEGEWKLFFCLPGNPVSAAVTCHLFVLPALRAIAGHLNPYPPNISVHVPGKIKLDDRPEYKRVVISTNNLTKGLPTAIITGGQESSRVKSLHSANGLLQLPSKKDYGETLEDSVCSALVIGTLY